MGDVLFLAVVIFIGLNGLILTLTVSLWIVKRLIGRDNPPR